MLEGERALREVRGIGVAADAVVEAVDRETLRCIRAAGVDAVQSFPPTSEQQPAAEVAPAPAPTTGLILSLIPISGPPEPDQTPDAVALADAVVASARESGISVFEKEARPGAPIERLAPLVALTDLTATYPALGLGPDPSVSRHAPELRARTP